MSAGGVNMHRFSVLKIDTVSSTNSL